MSKDKTSKRTKLRKGKMSHYGNIHLKKSVPFHFFLLRFVLRRFEICHFALSLNHAEGFWVPFPISFRSLIFDISLTRIHPENEEKFKLLPFWQLSCEPGFSQNGKFLLWEYCQLFFYFKETNILEMILFDSF